MRRAIFGNVGTVISFRIGNTDAEVLEKEFGEDFRAQQFVDLDRYEVIVRLLENGENRVPFLAKTLAPLDYNGGRREKLIARSRERFAVPRAVVEEKINRWLNSSHIVEGIPR